MAKDKALEEYLKVIGELDARLSELKELVENHFNYEPGCINWGMWAALNTCLRNWTIFLNFEVQHMKYVIFGNVVISIDESKFKLGQLVMTKGVHSDQARDRAFACEVTEAFARYVKCDWGDLCDEDKRNNDSAVKNGDDRILASYITSRGKLWVITEWDRSATTILYADEY